MMLLIIICTISRVESRVPQCGVDPTCCGLDCASSPVRAAMTAAAMQLDFQRWRRLLHRQAVLGVDKAVSQHQTGRGLDTSVVLRAYYYDWWHAGAPHGASCASMERLGTGGEAGKVVCDPDQLLSERPCHVVSVGSNGDAEFEKDVHKRAPHCSIDTYDGTLTGIRRPLRANIPGYVAFHDENWDRRSWRTYERGLKIALLKIDCEGCELAGALEGLLTNYTVDQIAIETHGCVGAFWDAHHPGADAFAKLDITHTFHMQLHEAGYRVFAAEANLFYSDGTCIEFSFVRVASEAWLPMSARAQAGSKSLLELGAATPARAPSGRRWGARKAGRKAAARGPKNGTNPRF